MLEDPNDILESMLMPIYEDATVAEVCEQLARIPAFRTVESQELEVFRYLEVRRLDAALGRPLLTFATYARTRAAMSPAEEPEELIAQALEASSLLAEDRMILLCDVLEILRTQPELDVATALTQFWNDDSSGNQAAPEPVPESATPAVPAVNPAAATQLELANRFVGALVRVPYQNGTLDGYATHINPDNTMGVVSETVPHVTVPVASAELLEAPDRNLYPLVGAATPSHSPAVENPTPAADVAEVIEDLAAEEFADAPPDVAEPEHVYSPLATALLKLIDVAPRGADGIPVWPYPTVASIPDGVATQTVTWPLPVDQYEAALQGTLTSNVLVRLTEDVLYDLQPVIDSDSFGFLAWLVVIHPDDNETELRLDTYTVSPCNLDQPHNLYVGEQGMVVTFQPEAPAKKARRR
jgi:hypothetical protein